MVVELTAEMLKRRRTDAMQCLFFTARQASFAMDELEKANRALAARIVDLLRALPQNGDA